LNPLNLKNYQTEIDDLTARVSNLETGLTNLQQQIDEIGLEIGDLQTIVNTNNIAINNLTNEINQVNSNVLSLTTSLTSLTNSVNQLTGEVNGMNVNLTSLVSLYQPIYSFYLNNLTFTDFHGHTASGEMTGFGIVLLSSYLILLLVVEKTLNFSYWSYVELTFLIYLKMVNSSLVIHYPYLYPSLTTIHLGYFDKVQVVVIMIIWILCKHFMLLRIFKLTIGH
jgi:uncharacterized coiled-coil protein SlyX